MADQITEIKGHIPPKEQERAAIKGMAERILTIADQIAAERRLSPPKPVNFTSIFHGESFYSATVLKDASQGILPNFRALPVHLEGMDVESGLFELGGHKEVPHRLTLDFLQRLGFTKADEPVNLRDHLSSDRKSVVIRHPSEPFNAECRINGQLDSGDPRLVGFTLRYQP